MTQTMLANLAAIPTVVGFLLLGAGIRGWSGALVIFGASFEGIYRILYGAWL